MPIQASQANKPRRGGLVIINATRRGSQGQIGKVAFSVEMESGLITLYKAFYVINVSDVRPTEAERKKKPKMNPSYIRDTNLNAKKFT